LPHQQKNEEVQDQENDREDVRARQNRARVIQTVAFAQGRLLRRRLSQRRAANVALGFTSAN
jgi:hypothetical protein